MNSWTGTLWDLGIVQSDVEDTKDTRPLKTEASSDGNDA